MNSRISPATYLGIAIAFLMPFLDMSCQGHKVATLTGYEVAFGTELPVDSLGGGQKAKQKVEPTPLIAVAFFLTAIAAGVALWNGIGGAVCAGIAGVCLILGQSEINRKIMAEGKGLFAVDFQVGFYLSLMLILVGAGVGIASETMKRNAPSAPQEPQPNTIADDTSV